MKKYQDHYFKKAKQENYPARSVYKLQEINKRFSVLRRGAKVLDLGACPGSWTLYAAKVVGPEGRVLGVDLNPAGTEFPPNVRYLVGDVFDPPPPVREAMDHWAPFHAVISDMAPKTTGIKFRDQALSFELCMRALALAEELLVEGGFFVAKIFEGPEAKEFADAVKARFEKLQIFKPKSSREESKEIFYIGMRLKKRAPRVADAAEMPDAAGAPGDEAETRTT